MHSQKKLGVVFSIIVLMVIIFAVLLMQSLKKDYYTIIINAQIREKNDNHFAGCYYKWKENNYLITDYYTYKNDDLIEYKSPTTAGFAIFNLKDTTALDNVLSLNGSKLNRHKKLWFRKKSDHFVLNDNEKFKFDEIKNDTIVSKIDKTFIKVVISKNTDE